MAFAFASFLTLLMCGLLTLENVTAAPPTGANSIKVSDLPPPKSGPLGYNRLIQPKKQTNHVSVYYPEPAGAGYRKPDSVAYNVQTIISFQAVQSTRRIVINANPEWSLGYPGFQDTKVSSHNETHAVETILAKELYFNSEDQTLTIDLERNLQTSLEHLLFVYVQTHEIAGGNHHSGIQAFNTTSQDTGETFVTVGLSPELQSMRLVVPCFDDPVYSIPYDWTVRVFYGSQPPAIAMMNGKRGSTIHYCEDEDKRSHYSYYEFSFPKMAIEMTQLRIGPYAWYPAENVEPPPPQCY